MAGSREKAGVLRAELQGVACPEARSLREMVIVLYPSLCAISSTLALTGVCVCEMNWWIGRYWDGWVDGWMNRMEEGYWEKQLGGKVPSPPKTWGCGSWGKRNPFHNLGALLPPRDHAMILAEVPQKRIILFVTNLLCLLRARCQQGSCSLNAL